MIKDHFFCLNAKEDLQIFFGNKAKEMVFLKDSNVK